MRFELVLKDGDILGSFVVTMGTNVSKDWGVGWEDLECVQGTERNLGMWTNGMREEAEENDLCSES